MPMRVNTMKEERLSFVLEALSSKKTFTYVCQKYHMATKTGYKWLNRFILYGESGLEETSRAPRSNSKAITEEVKAAIISIKNEYPTWGAKKIIPELLLNYPHLKTPSEGSVYNLLKKNELIKSRYYRRHVAVTSPLEDCFKPNDVWMYDFKGWFKTADGSKCEPLTITDGFSRFLLQCQHMDRKRECDVWKVLERSFYEFGLPNRLRSDNGPPFATLGVGRLSALSIKLIKAGVIPEWIEPGCPQQNGRHERFHLTLKNETANPPALTLSLQKEKFIHFQKYYNQKRHHEALNFKTPAAIYTKSKRIWDGKLRSPEYSNDYEVRKVCKGGCISWKGKSFFISESLYGENIGLLEVEGLMEIYYGLILLGKIDLSRGFKKI